jgi:hypothetical protein
VGKFFLLPLKIQDKKGVLLLFPNYFIFISDIENNKWTPFLNSNLKKGNKNISLNRFFISEREKKTFLLVTA